MKSPKVLETDSSVLITCTAFGTAQDTKQLRRPGTFCLCRQTRLGQRGNKMRKMRRKMGKRETAPIGAAFFFLIFAFLSDFYFRYSSSALSGPTGPSRTCKRFRTACGLAVHERHHSSIQRSSCRRDKNSLSSPCVPPPVSAAAAAAIAPAFLPQHTSRLSNVFLTACQAARNQSDVCHEILLVPAIPGLCQTGGAAVPAACRWPGGILQQQEAVLQLRRRWRWLHPTSQLRTAPRSCENCFSSSGTTAQERHGAI